MSNFKQNRTELENLTAFPIEVVPGEFKNGAHTVVTDIPYTWNTAGIDHGGTQKFWQKGTGLAQTPKTIPISFFATVVSLVTYVTVAKILFIGTNELGTPTSIKAIAYRTAGTGTFSIQVINDSDSSVICELTGQSNTTSSILNLGTLSNLKATEEILNVQIKNSDGLSLILAEGLSINF